MRRTFVFLCILILPLAVLWLRRCVHQTEASVAKADSAITSSSTAPPQPTAAQGHVLPDGRYISALPTPVGPDCPTPDALHAATKDKIRIINPNEVRIGDVRLLKNERTLMIPARVEVRTELLEYAMVQESGKAHESLLVTKVPVQDLHVAALLLGAVGQSPKIEVRWLRNGGATQVPLTDLIHVEHSAENTLSANPWIYNGSEFNHGSFAAMREGSIAALVNDPSALVNHPAAAALMRDDVFFAKSEKLPAPGVPVIVLFIFSKIR